MDDNTQQLIKGRVSVLPEKVKEVLFNTSWRPMVKNIGDRYNLTDDQKESLKTEIFLILSGLEPLSNFRTNLVQVVDTSYDQALKIAHDANIHIFSSIIEELKGFELEIKKVDEEATIEQPLVVGGGAENILKSQLGENTQRGNGSDRREMSEISKEGVRSDPEIHPDHILPDHEEMEKLDGIHLHSQSVMPSNTTVPRSFPKPAPTPAPVPVSAPMSSSVSKPVSVSAPAPANLPTMAPKNTPAQTPGIFSHPNPEQPKSSFRSIVDEKLSSLVRSTNEAPHTQANTQANPNQNTSNSTPKPKGYDGNDPYREPLQ